MSMMDKVVENTKEIGEIDEVYFQELLKHHKQIKAHEVDMAMELGFHPLKTIYEASGYFSPCHSNDDGGWYLSIIFKHKGKYYHFSDSG